MMAEDMLNRLKKKRSVLRASVSKIINRMETEMQKENVNENTLGELLEQLTDKAECLKINDDALEPCFDIEDFEREITSSDEYREKIVTWKFRVNKKLRVKNFPTLDEPKIDSSRRECTSVKLPKITIPIFSGDVSQWLTFWSSFETAIHKNEVLNKVDKFNYLKAQMTGTALSTIAGFAVSSENYDEAIALLKDRFGREDILINAHMSNLLHIPSLMRSTDIAAFRKLYDVCLTNVRSLESLGVSLDTYGNLLCPMILKILPSDLVFEFNKEVDDAKYNVKDLMAFLSKQLSARERSHNYATQTKLLPPQVKFLSPHSGGESWRQFDDVGKSKQHGSRRYQIPTAADLVSSEVQDTDKSVCVFCSGKHNSYSCEYARKLSLEEKKCILMKRGACFRCLKTKHLAKNCKARVFCSNCKKRHCEIMCFSTRNNCSDRPKTEKENRQAMENAVLSNHSCYKEVYLQTLIVRIKENGLESLIRAIFDTGSQKSYISKFVAEKLKLHSLGEATVVHGLFGGVENIEKHKRYLIKVNDIENKCEFEFEVMDQKKICVSIPKNEDSQCIQELNNLGIFVSDMALSGDTCLFEENPNEIHLLIGADMAGNLFTGNIRHLSKGLLAMETHLGWTVMGKGEQRDSGNTTLSVLSLHVSHDKISDLWSLDSLGILDPYEKRTKSETQELVIKHFKDTVTRDEEGRYQVRLPWQEGHPSLSDHKELARKRLKGTVRNLNSQNKLKLYQEVFDEWEKQGIIEMINTKKEENSDENLSVHYLPHRAVIKEHATTKIRPVFDGSARTNRSVALNDCIEKGPNLIELIPSILNRFRWGKIGVTADIRKAFLQIALHENDRDFLRFLWWKDGDPYNTVTYRHCRVVFGVSCSPFLLMAVLIHHLDQAPVHLRKLAEKLKSSMYVDNCVASVDTSEELENFRSESQRLLESAKFDLRGWKSNHMFTEGSEGDLNELNDENYDTQLLGFSWNVKEDTLSCNDLNMMNDNEPVTKRSILSAAHRVFDPIGFTCPITLVPKLLLQECWKIKASWDSELPKDIVKRFKRWKEQLLRLKEARIPRRLSTLEMRYENLTLHVFCDASRVSYATCVFLRVAEGDRVTCQLVLARSRVAPLKDISIPRLELLACCIGARLAKTVKEDLHLESVDTFYWSDSMDALYWIKKDDNWGTFVSNRVKEIRSLSQSDKWNFVPGVQNPADLPSRGCSLKKLVKERWWEGPSWLRFSSEKWPNFELIPDAKTVNEEKKKTVISSINEEKIEYYHRLSSYKKIIRITAWICRFIRNTKHAVNKTVGELTSDEITKAERTILKRVQEDIFSSKNDKRLNSLPIIVDAAGLLRVKTRIFMRDDTEEFRYPIVLPPEHSVVERLIMSKHKELGHSGVQTLMAALREKYWILRSRKSIKKVIKGCAICQRHSVKPPKILEGPLPEDRVKDASVFEIIGADVAGPLILKNKQKAWILMITCAVYRAVHLEMLTAMTTENFLLAFRRFIARRGRPCIIYSDNGTNFVGAENLLKNIDWEKLKADISPISWKFIPPAAPWWGGFWERLIGLMKRILRRVLGRTSLTYDEMSTVLCECENLLNSRPLTYVSDNADDLQPLTPAMFLHEVKKTGVPDLDLLDQTKFNKRYTYRQKVKTDLHNRFRTEYLGQLRQTVIRGNQVYAPKVGDIVLLWDDNSKRIDWPLGKILEVYPSKDGLIRVVKLKTKSGVLVRPVRKLCPMELAYDIPSYTTDVSDDLGTPPADDVVTPASASSKGVITTRYGRVVKPPRRSRF